MNQEEIVTSLNEVYEILRSAGNRAQKIQESTQNPSQSSLDANYEEISEARRSVYFLIERLRNLGQ